VEPPVRITRFSLRYSPDADFALADVLEDEIRFFPGTPCASLRAIHFEYENGGVMWGPSTAFLFLTITLSVFGQTYTISTIAGGALPLDIPGTSASLGLGAPQHIAVDATGNIYFIYHNTILRLDATTGILTLAAGDGTTGSGGDGGPAISAQLSYPQGLAVDSSGNLYIADTLNCRIRKVSNGVITTVAGNGTAGSSGDKGLATSAQLYSPYAVAVDSSGNLYIADFFVIREVSNGVINTVAGGGNQYPGDGGPATRAELGQQNSIAVDSVGNLYIAGSSLVRIVSGGVIKTVAGNGTSGFSGDGGPATSAQLFALSGIAVDAAGSFYISDNFRVREVSNGVITTVAGGGNQYPGDGGPATSAALSNPQDLAMDSAGNLYIADSFSARIRKVSNGVISTLAGGGLSVGDDGPAVGGQLALYSVVGTSVALSAAGDLYIADTGNNRIRKVSNGVITTVAGNGTQGFGGDNGPATSAQLNFASGVAVDSVGNLYIGDVNNQRIREVSNGVITTVAGNGTLGFIDGLATSAEFFNPVALALDPVGSLYISDNGNSRIRKLLNGVITTVTVAEGLFPTGLAVDSSDNIYIADPLNLLIREVSNGVITRAAANLNDPTGVAVDSAGSLYIADGNVVRKLTGGVMTTIAGNGGYGFSGDNGPATSAKLAFASGLAVDSAGNVYVADTGNNRIRLLTPNAASCNYSVAPNTLQAPASGGNLTVGIQTSASCTWAISNLPSWIAIGGAASGTGPATVTLTAAPNSGSPLSAMILVAGLSVTVTQPAASSCTYALSSGGQAFGAAGGNGTIDVTASAGCTWTAAGNASWVTINGAGTGTGNGMVKFQAAANSGGARSGTITIANLTFTVEEASATIAGLASTGAMAQLASQGSWTTIINLARSSTSNRRAHACGLS
jgi:sugar lactone lactonase YvrE